MILAGLSVVAGFIGIPIIEGPTSFEPISNRCRALPPAWGLAMRSARVGARDAARLAGDGHRGHPVGDVYVSG